MVAVWKGVQASFQHRNPYDDATTREIQIFYYGRPLTPADRVNPMAYAYPMQTILLFAPIGLLPWTAVRIGFFVLLPLLTAASVLLWIHVANLDLSRRSVVLSVLFTLCSWPVMWGVHQIQPTLIVGFLAAAGCLLLQRNHPIPAGIIFALATFKPQLIGVLLAWLFLWAALRRTWSFFVSFALTLAPLLALSARILPNWITSWRRAAAEYARYRHLQLELQSVFGHTAGLLLVLALAVPVSVILFQHRRSLPQSRQFGAMCSLCLALTLLILPSELAMTYNYILLIPACIILANVPSETSGASLARRIALIFLVWSFVSSIISASVESIAGPSNLCDVLPFQTMLFPAAVLVALALALSLEPPFSRACKITADDEIVASLQEVQA